MKDTHMYIQLPTCTNVSLELFMFFACFEVYGNGTLILWPHIHFELDCLHQNAISFTSLAINLVNWHSKRSMQTASSALQNILHCQSQHGLKVFEVKMS